MASLRHSFERLGLEDVRTYIDSGNVLFRKAGSDAAALERKIDAMLFRQHGLHGKTVARAAMMKFGRSPIYQDATVRNVTTTKKILELMSKDFGKLHDHFDRPFDASS